MADKENSYSSLTEMVGLEYYRRRIDVDMGSTSAEDGKNPRALIQMGQEVLSNSIDEANSGYGDEITITIHGKDSKYGLNAMTIADHGRGLPRDLKRRNKKTGKEEIVKYESAIGALTRKGVGGKFSNKDYKAGTGGRNAIGLKGTTAGSRYMIVEAQTLNDEHYLVRIDYDKFIVNDEPTEVKDLKFVKKNGTYTQMTFLPDDRVLDNIDWQRDTIEDRYQMAAYLAPGVKITLVDERELVDGKPYTKSWYSEHGLSDYVGVMAQGQEISQGFFTEQEAESDGKTKKTQVPSPIHFDGMFDTGNKDGNDKEIEIQVHGDILWTESQGDDIQTFANGIPTLENGFHLTGFKQGVKRAITDFVDDKKLLKRGQSFDDSDIFEGLVAAIEVKVPEAILEFEGQTKEKLGTADAKKAALKVVQDAVSKWLYDNAGGDSSSAIELVEKMAAAKEARDAASDAKEQVKAAREAKKNQDKDKKLKLEVSSKLTRATQGGPGEKELFVVEGDSACARWDTMIRLVDGRNITIKQVAEEFEAGKTNYVFSQTNVFEDIDEDLQGHGMVPMPITWAGVTRENAEMIRLYIDNDSHVDVTPDHKFLLVDGTYKRADELSTTDSLNVMTQSIKRDHMHFHISTKASNGFTDEGIGGKIHRRVAEWYGDSENGRSLVPHLHVHHKDRNKLNNNPENLAILTPSEHSKITVRENASDGDTFGARTHRLYENDPEYRARQKEIQAAGGRAGKGVPHNQVWDAAQRANTSRTTSEGMKNIDPLRWVEMRNSQWITCTLAVYKTLIEHGHSIEDIKTAHEIEVSDPRPQDKWNKSGKISQLAAWKYELYGNIRRKGMSYPALMEKLGHPSEEELSKMIANANHKIVRIEKIAEREDVYDLNVDGTHNFALSNDLFVHNCGTIKQGRFDNQAVFPLRGKILNTLDEKIGRVLQNKEVSTIAAVLGSGVGPSFDPNEMVKKSGYGKVIIAADSDDDGYHIQSLVITLFAKWFPGMIENGHLFIAQAPLFNLRYYVKGKKVDNYAFNEQEKEEIAAKLDKKGVKYHTTRFKGLGEASSEGLRQTMMDSNTRHLLQLSMDDAQEAMKMIHTAMGKVGDDAAKRNSWVRENSVYDDEEI